MCKSEIIFTVLITVDEFLRSIFKALIFGIPPETDLKFK